MSEVHAEIEIAAPPEEVWSKAVGPRCLEDWVTIHRRLHSSDDGELKNGYAMEQSLAIRGAKFKVKWKATEVEPGRRVVWEGKGPARSKARTEYVVEPSGDGTRFKYTNSFSAPLGPLGAAASKALVGGVPEREATSSLKALKQLLERR